VRNKLTLLPGGKQKILATARSAGVQPEMPLFASSAVAVSVDTLELVEPAHSHAHDPRLEAIREARMKGYEGDSCGECGNFTLVRNGTCLKCDTCGSTSGCS
jgi:ribonucleoside-diphosphate reductase alpha chain